MAEVDTPAHARLRRVSALLEVALELPPERRGEWLDALPADDRALMASMRGMLSRSGGVETDSFMREPVALLLEDLDDADDGPDDAPGDDVGPYRLVRPLGEGGMGTVWLAERHDSTLQRQIALKLPHAGGASGLARRMARERDILAALEHPNIARLYDAGVTPEGRPWLAMERVDGVPLDVYCREHALEVPARLRLFLQVADAVAHAHARLVVHRDLKPSNILVTADGQVRLLDFGIAKLLDGDRPATAALTQQIGRAVTPDYAAPEQIAGQPVTVASDVYSLGIVLYELLTGERPYSLSRTSAAALEQAVREADVQRASSRVAGDRRRARALRGDLDAILAKALHKEPAERYASMDAFAADLRRHLAGEPVLAQAPSWRYRAGKFVRRHRLGLVAGGAVAASLVVGLGAALWQAQQATRQAQLALSRLQLTEATLDFTTMVLTEGIGAGEALTLKQLVQRSEALAEGRYASSPMERATAADAVATWYNAIGDYEQAERLLDRTLAALPPDFDGSVLGVLRCKRAHAIGSRGRTDESAAALDAALEALGPGDDARVDCLQLRGLTARRAGDSAGALRHAQEALRTFDRVGRRNLHDRAVLLVDVAFALSLNDRPAEAIAQFRAAERTLEASGRTQSQFALTMQTAWAVMLANAGDQRASVERFDRAQAIAARLSPNGELPLPLLNNLGATQRALGHFDEAIRLHRAALDVARRQKNIGQQVQALAGLAIDLVRHGQVALAREQVEEGERVAVDAGLAPASSPMQSLQRARAFVLAGERRWREADALLETLAARLGGRGGAGLWTQRAEIVMEEGRPADALPLAQRALATAIASQGDLPHSSATGEAWLALARAQLALGQRTTARESAVRAQAQLAGAYGPGHAASARAQALIDTLRETAGR